MYCLCSISLSRMACLTYAACDPSLRHAIDDVLHEMKAIQVVQHHHVERRGRRAFLLVAAHVQVLVIRAAIGQSVNQPADSRETRR